MLIYLKLRNPEIRRHIWKISQHRFYKCVLQIYTLSQSCESCVVYVVSYKHRYIWCYWNFFKQKSNNATKMATWFGKTSCKLLPLLKWKVLYNVFTQTFTNIITRIKHYRCLSYIMSKLSVLNIDRELFIIFSSSKVWTESKTWNPIFGPFFYVFDWSLGKLIWVQKRKGGGVIIILNTSLLLFVGVKPSVFLLILADIFNVTPSI